jgi:outer membrane receptor protein involved in Fe transport
MPRPKPSIRRAATSSPPSAHRRARCPSKPHSGAARWRQHANQLSPRISFTYLPFEFTRFHFGYARYFTPPVLVEAAPANIALFNGTTGAAASGGTDAVLPERSHYFDAGVDQNIPFGCSKPAAKDCTDLDLGMDVYYKLATDLIDNGNFGQALVLSAFNYGQGVVEGIEFTAKFHSGKSRDRPRKGDQCGVERVSVRQYHTARRSRRPDATAIRRFTLDFYGPHPTCDRLGRLLVSGLWTTGICQ